MNYNKSVSEKIKKIRNKLDMSQERFGKKIGLSGKTISAYETGKCIPPLKILEKICEEYNTDFVQLNSQNKTSIEEKLQSIKTAMLDIEQLFLDK